MKIKKRVNISDWEIIEDTPKLKRFGDGGSVEKNKKILKEKGILPEQTFQRNKYQESLSNNLKPIGYDYNSFVHALYEKNKGREVLENRAKDTDPYASNLIPKSRLDAFNFYMGKPQKYNTFDVSDYRPSKETDFKTNYYKLNYFQDYYAPDSNVTDLENLFKTKSLAETDLPFLFSKKEKQKVNAADAPVMANYTLSKGEDEKGKYYSYYDKWDIAPMDFGKPFEIYDRIYYDPSTNKIIPPKKPYIQKAPLPGQSVQVLEFKNGGSINKYPNGGKPPKYEWSKGIDNIQPITQTQNNSSITTGNKKLSTEELKKAAEYTKKYNQQHLEEEYNNRQNKLKQSIDAQKQPLSLKNLQTQTQSTGDKLSLAMNSKYGNPKDYPTLSGYIQGLDYINPFKMIGDMASGLGSAPQDVNEGNYLKAGLSVGTPLFAGATAGIGTQGIKPFVNNLVNPLAGTGEVINNLGNKYLPNAYKLNPYAFKPNSEMMYRGIGKEGMEDALESGVFRAKQNVAPIMDETGRFDMSKQFQGTYYSPKFNTADQYGAGYIAEVPKDVTNFRLRYKGKGNKTWSQIADENIPIDKGKILKKDWLQGYKPIEIPKSNFKSEIDWSKWNKEIPENTQLMKEYNAIEQQTKANNTWMKNPDGSEFQGTPEQFVQQNSENFKKAFPEGSDRVYRGGNNENFSNDRGHPIVFTADKETARNYVGSVSPFTGDYELASPDAIGGRVLFDMYHPKNNSNLIINNQGKSWREISRNHFGENSPVRDLHNTKGDFTSTDDIAKWMVANDKNSVRLNNIFDSYDAKFVDIVNHKQGNYLKSATSNNGMFDMTNPNIYKALVPGVIGLGAASQIDKKEFGGNITRESEWELVNETNKKLPKRRLNLNKSSDWEIVD